MIELGSKVKDIVSGFEGIATGRAEYMTGCVQYLVSTTKLGKDGDIQNSHWFDEMRLKVTAKPSATLAQARDRFAATQPGGPQDEPRGRK